MRFLIDEDLPRATDRILRQYGHEAIDICDVGLRGATHAEVVAYAQKHELCLLAVI
jgi:predicted nuclease of predicted toxin-antitoxin system